MVTTSWSENSPLQGIKFPCGGSSGVENGLNNLGWETWVYELAPLRGQAHSSGWGWNLESPAWDRRSLLTGSSRGGPSRRDFISGNHTLPGHRRQWKVVEPGPGELSTGLPGAKRSGEMHTDKASATSAPSRPVQEELDTWGRTRVGSETSLKTQTDPIVPGRTPSISTPPLRGGASIHSILSLYMGEHDKPHSAFVWHGGRSWI